LLLTYQTIHHRAESTIVINKSRFIGLAAPIRSEEDAHALQREVRDTHPEASHHCFAYRIGDSDEVQRASDDGEPSGTAGRPILEVIEREQLHYAIVIVTRYFGGTLLGAGGLVRAYAQTTSAAIREAGVVVQTLHSLLCIDVDYTKFGKLEYELPRLGYPLEHVAFTQRVAIEIHVPGDRVAFVKEWIADQTSGQATVAIGATLYKAN